MLFVSGAADKTVLIMKALHFLFLTTLASLPLQAQTTAPDGNANFRQWKDVSGRTVEATFRGVENGQVYLQTRNGFVHRIPMERLAPEDLKLAQTLKPEGLGIPKDPNVAQAAAVTGPKPASENTQVAPQNPASSGLSNAITPPAIIPTNEVYNPSFVGSGGLSDLVNNSTNYNSASGTGTAAEVIQQNMQNTNVNFNIGVGD
jgi:hypothetical protein